MWKNYSVAALAVAAAGTTLLASAPPRQAAHLAEDHAAIKARQEASEKAAGIVPGVNSGFGLRGVCAFSAGREPNIAIPDFAASTPGVVTDQMVTSGDPLLNVRVRLNIVHPFQGDIIATLRHEASGIEVTLIDRPGVPELSTVGFSADNYGDNAAGIPFVLDNSSFSRYDNPDVVTPGIANVTGNWLADDQFNSLAVFDGLPADTTWTLTVSDNFGIDVGTLVRWSICSDNEIGQTVPTGFGAASPNPAVSGDSVLFTVQVSPAAAPVSTGLAVQADLSQVGGSATQMFFDDGSNGDVFPGDNVFSYQTVVTGSTGVYSLPFTVSDAEARSSNGTIAMSIAITNDVCEDAISVSVGSSIVSTNVDATNDPGQPTCSGLSTFNAGVWFTTVGNGNVLNLTTCSPNTVLNTRLYVYTGSCGAFTCVGAATGTTPACSPTTAASVQICSTLGQTYYILITNDTTGTGQFELSVLDAGPCPANDNCPGDVVTAPSNTAGTTVGLTPSGVTSCGANSADAFYRFTPPTSGLYTIDLCGSSFDTRLSVFTDCTSTMIGCNDDACSTQSRLILNLNAGTEYHIRVSAYDATVTGAFVLNISDPPPPPTGACCVSGNCSITTEADCATAGGSYIGDNSTCDPGVFTSTTVLPIPDAGCGTGNGVEDSLVLPSLTLNGVSVRVQIPAHTFLADLQISVTFNGTTVVLMDDQCGSFDGMDITFQEGAPAITCATPTVGTFAPLQSLSVFNGLDSAGTWTLSVCDDAGADVGTLVGWSIIADAPGAPPVCGGGPQFCDADWCQDGSKSVADIFCFLADWFANDFDARNYGGTPGVPAIFAFLSVWFATPNGTCTP